MSQETGSKYNWKGQVAGYVLIVVGLFAVLYGGYAGYQALQDRGMLLPTAKPSVTTETAGGTDLPRGALQVQPALPASSSATPVAVTQGGELMVRMGQIAWPATIPSHFANGGTVTAPNSLMARSGIKMEIVRQDDYSKLTAEMAIFAKDHKAGKQVGKIGYNVVQMMGDGSPAFIKGVNEALKEFGGSGIIIYKTGFSFGEDKAIGPKEWLVNPSSMKGAVVAGVRGDGDLHLFQDFANKQKDAANPNGIRVNPNQKCWDPEGINFVGTPDFKTADLKFVKREMATFECTVTADGKSVKPGKVTKPVEGTATWAPGDKWVHDNYKGTTPIVALRTTADNIWQMPAVVIVHKDWAYKNFDKVVDMILAFSEAADLIRASDSALQKTCSITAQVYAEADQQYWCNTFKGFPSTNPLVQYRLGGSRVVNLADNMLYFKALPGSQNTFDRVYEYFAKLDMHTFPDLFEDSKGNVSVPSYESVVDTAFMKAAWSKLEKRGVVVAAAVPDYKKSVTTGVALANVSYPDILFDTGLATLKPESEAALDRMLTDLASDGGKIAVIGHTDDVGPLSLNMDLSKRRAATVAQWLQKKAPMSFTDRFAKIDGKGPNEPPQGVTGLSTEDRRAQMRRVQIIVLRTETQFK